MKRRWFVADWCIEALLTVGSSSSRPLINWRQTWSTRLLSVTWWRASSTPGLSTVQSSVNWQCRHSGHSGHSNPKYYIATYVSKINWLIWKLDLIFTEFWTLVVFPRSARNVNREWRFVVNLPGAEGEDDFVQSVKIQRCLRPGESCNIEASGFSSTVCR